MGYGVPTSGVQGFNEDSGTHYRAGNAAVCAGSAGFSVLLAFECMELGGLYANIGNIDTGGSPSGWFSERFPDVGNKPLYTWRITTSGGPIGFSYPLGSGSFIFGRTVLLAMTVDDEAEELAAFWNGAPIGATAYDTPGDTYVPAAGVARFQLGNASQLTANGTTDRLSPRPTRTRCSPKRTCLQSGRTFVRQARFVSQVRRLACPSATATRCPTSLRRHSACRLRRGRTAERSRAEI